MNTTEPQIFITNYQNYVNREFLETAIGDSLLISEDIELPASIYLSIAYFTVNKVGMHNTYDSVLSLSMKGKSFVYKLRHNNEDIYEANKRLIIAANKSDADIKTLNSAFETLVFMRVEKIVTDLVNAYKI